MSNPRRDENPVSQPGDLERCSQEVMYTPDFSAIFKKSTNGCKDQMNKTMPQLPDYNDGRNNYPLSPIIRCPAPIESSTSPVNINNNVTNTSNYPPMRGYHGRQQQRQSQHQSQQPQNLQQLPQQQPQQIHQNTCLNNGISDPIAINQNTTRFRNQCRVQNIDQNRSRTLNNNSNPIYSENRVAPTPSSILNNQLNSNTNSTRLNSRITQQASELLQLLESTTPQTTVGHNNSTVDSFAQTQPDCCLGSPFNSGHINNYNNYSNSILPQNVQNNNSISTSTSSNMAYNFSQNDLYLPNNNNQSVQNILDQSVLPNVDETYRSQQYANGRIILPPSLISNQQTPNMVSSSGAVSYPMQNSYYGTPTITMPISNFSPQIRSQPINNQIQPLNQQGSRPPNPIQINWTSNQPAHQQNISITPHPTYVNAHSNTRPTSIVISPPPAHSPMSSNTQQAPRQTYSVHKPAHNTPRHQLNTIRHQHHSCLSTSTSTKQVINPTTKTISTSILPQPNQTSTSHNQAIHTPNQMPSSSNSSVKRTEALCEKCSENLKAKQTENGSQTVETSFEHPIREYLNPTLVDRATSPIRILEPVRRKVTAKRSRLELLRPSSSSGTEIEDFGD